MDLIKTEYIKKYQKLYQTEYYKNNREYVAEKNRVYYEINKEGKNKVVIKKVVIKKVVIMNFDLIKVERKIVRLSFD